MSYYLVNLLILVVIYLICCACIKNKEKKQKIFFFVAFIQLFLFLGLRRIDVGVDLQNYIPFLNRVINFNYEELFTIGFEPGYNVYCRIIMGIFDNKQVFLIITAAITLLGAGYFIYKNSKNYFFSIFIYVTFQFYIFLFSGLRQSIAISILLLSTKFIKERKLIKFIILVFLAGMFHKSAFIFLPAYFIAYKKITTKYLITIVGIGVMLFLFREYIMLFVTRYLYTGYDNFDNQGGGYGLLLLLFILFIVAFYFKKNTLEIDNTNIIWYNYSIIAILIQMLASIEGNVARLTMYYSISMVILIPNVLEAIKPKEISYVGKIILMVLLFVFLLNGVQSENAYMPYKFFWQL